MKRLFILFALVAAPLWAEDRPLPRTLLGPLRIQDMSPLALLRLDMLPPPPVQSDAKWRLELASSDANIYSMSDSVREYLEKRGSRGALTQAEATEMMKLSGSMFFFDSEFSLTKLTVTRRVRRHSELEVVFPYHAYGGGYLDLLVERFHRQAGLKDANRGLVPRNEVAIISRFGNTQRAFISGDGDSGFGDTTLTYRYFNRFASWTYVGEVSGRFPTGKNELYFSSSTPNYGAQLSLQNQTARRGIYLSASYVRPGLTRMLQATELSGVPSANIAWEHTVGLRMSAVIQASWSSGGFRDSDAPEMTRIRTEMSVGLRRYYRGAAGWIAITENVGHYRNTPDIVLHAGVTLLPLH